MIVPAISWATTYISPTSIWLEIEIRGHRSRNFKHRPRLLETALTPKTKMVVAVNILGNPCALTTIKTFCEKHNLILFEDNCESMGAILNNRYCGTFGHVGTFSTFFSHHISTMEGGVIITNDEELYELCLSLLSRG